MNIIISPIFQQFFSGRIWMGLDYRIIAEALEEMGYNVKVINFAQIAQNYNLLPQNSLFFYSFSYNDDYHQYMKDVLYDLKQSRPDIRLLPDLDMLFSFENKGYQELYRKRLAFGALEGDYFGDISDMQIKEIELPIVYKEINGAVSSGVHLVKHQSDIINLTRKKKKRNLWETVQYLRRMAKKKEPSSMRPTHEFIEKNFAEFFLKRHPFVLQKFIPNLDCDYRVLVFGDKYYTMRREVRKNDFRASGSGVQEWVDPSANILNFAFNITNKLQVPFISLDIAENTEGCYLIEYQGLGFGASALIKSDFYYKFKEDNWFKITEKSDLERTFAYAINHFIHENP